MLRIRERCFCPQWGYFVVCPTCLRFVGILDLYDGFHLVVEVLVGCFLSASVSKRTIGSYRHVLSIVFHWFPDSSSSESSPEFPFWVCPSSDTATAGSLSSSVFLLSPLLFRRDSVFSAWCIRRGWCTTSKSNLKKTKSLTGKLTSGFCHCEHPLKCVVVRSDGKSTPFLIKTDTKDRLQGFITFFVCRG